MVNLDFHSSGQEILVCFPFKLSDWLNIFPVETSKGGSRGIAPPPPPIKQIGPSKIKVYTCIVGSGEMLKRRVQLKNHGPSLFIILDPPGVISDLLCGLIFALKQFWEIKKKFPV